MIKENQLVLPELLEILGITNYNVKFNMTLWDQVKDFIKPLASLGLGGGAVALFNKWSERKRRRLEEAKLFQETKGMSTSEKIDVANLLTEQITMFSNQLKMVTDQNEVLINKMATKDAKLEANIIQMKIDAERYKSLEDINKVTNINYTRLLNKIQILQADLMALQAKETGKTIDK